MAQRDIRTILLRIVPVAVPVMIWGVEITPQDSQQWSVDLDPSARSLFSGTGVLSLEQCQSLCGTEAVNECEVRSGDSLQVQCTGQTVNGFVNGTAHNCRTNTGSSNNGCSCGQETPPTPPRDFATPLDFATPPGDLSPYQVCPDLSTVQKSPDLLSPPDGSSLPPSPSSTCYTVDPSAMYRSTSKNTYSQNCGRRPPGLLAMTASMAVGVRDRAGDWLCEQAHLEAASVQAFRILEKELIHHGAPPALVAAARRAARDEIRHARTIRRMAALRGATVPKVCVERRRLRSLEEIAVDNAVEGCVGETYGAAVAMWQARYAQDETVRAQLAIIAEEETQHAEFSWALDTWLRERLSGESLLRIDRAVADAAQNLREQGKVEPSAGMVAELGLPSAYQARQLVEALHTAAWS